MFCRNIESCMDEIEDYMKHPAGFPLLVGIDNPNEYTSILARLFDDPNKKVIRISDSCTGEFPPNPNLQIDKMRNMAREMPIVWIGASQSVMLVSQTATEEFLENLVGSSIYGHMIVLCPFCSSILTKISLKYKKLGQWILILPCEIKNMPSICLYADDSFCIDQNPAQGMKELLYELENLKEISHTISVVSTYNPKEIAYSMFPVSSAVSPYQVLCKQDTDISAFTKESYGTEEQWRQLAKDLSSQKSFSTFCYERLGDINQLTTTFPDFLNNGSDDKFLCYLALKMYHSAGNGYLNECIRMSRNADDILSRIYDAILRVKPSDSQFRRWMKERKRILQFFDDNHVLMQDYCSKAAVYGKDILQYLGDGTEEERAALIHALCCHHYTTEELGVVLPEIAPELDAYLRPFTFDALNTKVLESDAFVRAHLTEYFQQYKLQKICNRQDAEFIKIVEEEALQRSFTKLPARSSVVKKMDKSGVQPYFFDALGVEFLAYIEAKCKDYDMVFDCQITHCNLPSITSKNKEFYAAFPPDTILKEDGIDKLKHQGKKYDYRTTTEPLHIFDELQLLAHDLKKISICLATGRYKKAVILSDHGASRLAVTYESENEKMQLEEDGLHSGRCCPADTDPKIPFATFEDGFAVLANYERFKGSRKADVEAHGGASLEETIVPVIILTAKARQQQIFFVDDVVKCSPKDGTAIMLYADLPLAKPRLIVFGHSYEGSFVGDKRNIRFVMKDVRRKGQYEAEIYDGTEKISILTFRAERSTKAIEMF